MTDVTVVTNGTVVTDVIVVIDGTVVTVVVSKGTH